MTAFVVERCDKCGRPLAGTTRIRLGNELFHTECLPQRVLGISRMNDNPRAFLITLEREPTDDDLRSLHEHLRQWRR